MTIKTNSLLLTPGTTAQPLIIVVSRRGGIYIATRSEDNWISDNVNLGRLNGGKKVLSIVPLPTLKSFLAVRWDTVDLINIENHSVLQTFQIMKSRPNSVRCLYSTRRTPHFGYSGLASFSIVYTERDSEDCVLQTYTPGREEEVLCIDNKKCPQEQSHCPWDGAVMQMHRMKLAGKWETLPIGVIIGVRKGQDLTPSTTGYHPDESFPPSSSLRRREHTPRRPSSSAKTGDNDPWEAWLLTTKGERTSVSLTMNEVDGRLDSHLLVNTCGPMSRIGQRSIAVGLGNVIKVVTVGHEKFTADDSLDDMALAISSRRRRPGPTRKRSYGSADWDSLKRM